MHCHSPPPVALYTRLGTGCGSKKIAIRARLPCNAKPCHAMQRKSTTWRILCAPLRPGQPIPQLPLLPPQRHRLGLQSFNFQMQLHIFDRVRRLREPAVAVAGRRAALACGPTTAPAGANGAAGAVAASGGAAAGAAQAVPSGAAVKGRRDAVARRRLPVAARRAKARRGFSHAPLLACGKAARGPPANEGTTQIEMFGRLLSHGRRGGPPSQQPTHGRGNVSRTVDTCSSKPRASRVRCTVKECDSITRKLRKKALH